MKDRGLIIVFFWVEIISHLELRFGFELKIISQIEGLFGGNPALQEETSDTYTVGAVFRPSFAPGLNITVDYFNIKVEDYISTLGGGLAGTLNLCYNVIKNPNSAVCGLISRDSQGIISGPPFVVSANNANLASLKTRGVDFQLDYATRMGFGLFGDESRLAFSLLATYTDNYTFTPLVDLPDDNVQCAGRFGLNCDNPIPKWKANSRLSWIDGPITTSVRWRYVGPTRDDDDLSDRHGCGVGAGRFLCAWVECDVGVFSVNTSLPG